MEAEDYDHNVEKDGEVPVNIEGTAQGGTSKAGNKRGRAKPPLPPKAKKVYPKRSWLWAHFIQRNDGDPFSFCKYCHQQVGCDTKKSGTSAMKGHIERCNKYKDHQEMETHTVLGADKRGDMRVIRVEALLFKHAAYVPYFLAKDLF